MKKIVRTISNFFKGIWRFIDKKIVLPITKLIFSIMGKMGLSSKRFEYWLSKSNTLLFISLFLAIVIFIAIDKKVISFSESSAEIIKSQPVNVVYNEEAYVVEGLPETVDITLIGNKTDLYIAKQVSSYDLMIDLTGLKPGTHEVSVKYNKFSGSIDYKINPSSVKVTIYEKVSETRNLNYDLLNEVDLDERLIVDSVKLDKEEAIIKGTKDKLSEVATVKALVDINNLDKDELSSVAEKKAASLNLNDIVLKAYDKNGDVVDVEIVPNKISAKVDVISPSKTLPIKVIADVDKLSFGKAISSIDLSDDSIVVYGNKSTLDSMDYFPVEVDVSDLSENKQYKLELTKPKDIRSMSLNSLTVDIKLGEAADKTIDDINLEYHNLADGYSVYGETASDLKVSVVVKGVSGIIDSISSSDIKAYVDLSGYTEGQHEVPVIIEGNDSRVAYITKTKKVNLRIKK